MLKAASLSKIIFSILLILIAWLLLGFFLDVDSFHTLFGSEPNSRKMADERQATSANINDKDKFVDPRVAAENSEIQTLQNHPRILSVADNTLLEQVDSRANFGIYFADLCTKTDITSSVACYAMNPDPARAGALFKRLSGYELKPCTAGGNRGNAWLLALFLDQIALYKNQYVDEFYLISQRIVQAVTQCLTVLDQKSASLWHGRFSMGAEVFIASIVLPDSATNRELRQRALHHFLNSVEAIKLTEGWPGGYSYWINNRALTFFIAIRAYMNTLADPRMASGLVKLVERIGLWHIYMTRPDNRAAHIADDGPRNDLKDASRKVIDLIAKITGKRIFAAYSRYLFNLHGRTAYYRGYQWLIPFVFDPSVKPLADPGESMAIFRGLLADTQIFGKDAYNQVVIRSGWDTDDTFIQFRASNTFTHHQHYDAGHFTVFKKEPVIADSSVYFGTHTENRLYYGVRTVAKNSLLIHRPGDLIKPNHLFKLNVNDGGQRLAMPTGSAIQSVDHWRRNLYSGQMLAGARLVDSKLESETGEYRFFLDLTDAYDSTRFDSQNKGGKVKKVLRNIIYRKREDILIIHDRVWPTDNSYRVSGLLHVMQQPAQRVVDPDYAQIEIKSSVSERLATANIWSSGELDVNLIGGEDKRYWVNDVNLEGGGKNFSKGAQIKRWNDNPAWRIEYSSYAEDEYPVEFVTLINLGESLSQRPEIIKNDMNLIKGIRHENFQISLQK